MKDNNRYQILSERIPQFTKAIQKHIKDEQVKTLFLNFFKSQYETAFFNEHDRTSIHKHFEKFIINFFSNLTIQLISWEQYCLSMKCIRQNDWEEGQYSQLKSTKKVARQLVSNFYLYVLENTDSDAEAIAELKEHKEFLIWQERNSSKMNNVLNDHYLDRLGTNFPIGSSLSEAPYRNYIYFRALKKHSRSS